MATNRVVFSLEDLPWQAGQSHGGRAFIMIGLADCVQSRGVFDVIAANRRTWYAVPLCSLVGDRISDYGGDRANVEVRGFEAQGFEARGSEAGILKCMRERWEKEDRLRYVDTSRHSIDGVPITIERWLNTGDGSIYTYSVYRFGGSTRVILARRDPSSR
jgi:hypothetical protein